MKGSFVEVYNRKGLNVNTDNRKVMVLGEKKRIDV